MRVLVTGGAGFIGSHIATRLLETGRDVRVIDNFATGRRSNLAHLVGEVDVVEGDIRNLEELRTAVRGCDAVVHLAAVPSVPRSIADPATSHEANATGTLNVLMAARDEGACRVVFASSSSIYGSAVELPKHEGLTPLPISPYAVSKLAGESYCRSFYQVYELETVALRYFNVFGPRQDPQSEYAAVIPRFIWAYQHGEPPVIFGDGEQSRDFTYIENVVQANMAALEVKAIGGRVYNIACGDRITLNELAESLRREIGCDIEPVHGPDRPGDVRHSMADISKARAELGYEPVVDLEEGVRVTVDHYLTVEDGNARPKVMRSIQQAPARPAVAVAPRVAPRRRGRRFLITGGSGFIGSHLVEGLMEHDKADRIVILDDLSTGQLGNIEHLLEADRVSFVHGSVNDSQLVDELMGNADVCVHLASAVGVQMIVNEPLDTLMRSVRGSNVVMHAAYRHGVKVLFSSTSEVYGKQTHSNLTEQDDLVFGSPSRGRWTYAIAKSFGEALIHGYSRQRGVDATIVRLFNTVGPRQTGTYGMVLPRFVRQALAGEDLTVYGSGAQTRCFTHVRDTVTALMALCESEEASGHTFNVGSATPISIVELARKVIERAESDSKILLVPYEEAYGSGFEELGSRRPDTAALRNLTGWQTRLTVEDAIDDVIELERARLLQVSESVADVA
ncbi:MAG TPA: NAD-dependent epimerase/dehydratase family protein [Solirubrobacteraceae bacterium]|nr:NAD-dependent epimerase/dehydratase family protein [Solirubrobacteraceae bacterium]